MYKLGFIIVYYTQGRNRLFSFFGKLDFTKVSLRLFFFNNKRLIYVPQLNSNIQFAMMIFFFSVIIFYLSQFEIYMFNITHFGLSRHPITFKKLFLKKKKKCCKK